METKPPRGAWETLSEEAKRRCARDNSMGVPVTAFGNDVLKLNGHGEVSALGSQRENEEGTYSRASRGCGMGQILPNPERGRRQLRFGMLPVGSALHEKVTITTYNTISHQSNTKESKAK